MFARGAQFFALKDEIKKAIPCDPATFVGWEKDAEVSPATGTPLSLALFTGFDQSEAPRELALNLSLVALHPVSRSLFALHKAVLHQPSYDVPKCDLCIAQVLSCQVSWATAPD